MLVIKELEKSYGKFKALNKLNLDIKKGEIFGFIGPNGAGKSTTMKIVSGLLAADSGEVYVDGIDAIKNNRKLKEKIGYMPDFFGVYDNLKAYEYLEFYGSIYGISGKEIKKLSMDLLELVNLENKYDAYVDGLSRGMKQRLCLARCLIHNPQLLILDEPASGMDPRARFEMKNILKNLRDMDKTILVSSHILSELGEICTNIGIVESGQMVCQGTVEDIMNAASGNENIIINVLNNEEKAVKLLKEMPKVGKVKFENNEINITFSGNEEDSANLLKTLIMNDIPVISFNKETSSLEELFIKITDKNELKEAL
ncbi:MULTISPECIES: ABC transporter ATP-binding protein [unclassified Clostridium]|uniref:ABC transporter ATP-binding protein n=1 Tax=unclassified Clostridium TaxID=2614128 RepID=UPI0002980957|nr:MULTISPECIES: ABC transporter ATP-binding protein [unclassified Clostridium]EKQ51412.1 MAG: ABC-type multidrug transport system, ATPase component [Clostridium sp. Maddingley MBC34-26]